MQTLSDAARRSIIAEAQSTPDREVCGLVWGRGAAQVVQPMRNTHPDPRVYYAIDERDLREAFAIMDAAGGEPVGFYHSHPSGRREPSSADMEGALNVGMLYVIAYPDAEGQWQVSVWDCIDMGVLVAAQ